MISPRAQRLLRITIANVAVTSALLVATELACRYVEQVRHNLPPELRTLPPKSSSEIRVFAFGGSTVYGVPIPRLGFVAQIQDWLHRLYPDRNIRVYNFGLPGVNTSYVLGELTRRFDDRPDLMIVVTGHNEFLAQDTGTGGRITHLQETLFSHFAIYRVLQSGFERVMKSRKAYVMPCQVDPWDEKSASFKSRVADFEESMNLIVQRASQRGVKVMVGTLPSNLCDWPPVYKRLANRDQRYLDTVSQIQKLLQNGKYQEAADAVSRGFGVYGEDAMMYFLRGRLQAAMGAYSAARESFVRARELDHVPTRTSSQLNSIIRRAASGMASVYLVDLEKIYEEHSKNGLLGFDLIADNVHGTPLGESLSAQAIIQKMIEIGFLPAYREGQECCPVGTFLAETGYLEPKSSLRLHFLLHCAKYAMKTPFLNYDASQMYLLEAMQVDDNSWEVWANLATLSYFAGDTATATKELQRATELHHAPLDINDRGATPYLKEALDYAAGRASGCGAPL